jgi:hypothetical protein
MQVERRNIIPVLKFTITTYFLYTNLKLFSKIMTESQEFMVSTISVEGQPRKAVLAQICMGLIFSRSVSDTVFVMSFLPKPPRTTW